MKKKQAIAFLLSTTMTVGAAIPVFASASDINGHWAETTIAKWQNEGKIGGYEDGTFQPDKTITRAEFVRLLNTTSVNTFASTANINFIDVKESDWFYADVAQAVGGKIASGFEDGTFRPSETVTRMQAAVFICNAKGLTPNEAAANNFTDAASIPAWAKGAVGAAVAAGYLSGYPDGSFGGSKGMTRAEAVSTLDRVSSNVNKPAEPNQGVSVPSDDKKEKENNTKLGEMVWTSGGNGTSNKKSSSGGGSSNSSSSSNKYNNVKITSQADANKYKGATLKGTTEIYVSENLTFNDVTFENVEVYAENTVASAYIENNVEKTAVAAANSSVEVIIFFNGKTAVSGNINVNRNSVSDKVVIQVNTASSAKRVARSLFAKVKTVIRGSAIVSNVTAEAPVFVEEGANVSTIEAKNDASINVDKNSNVDTINATGEVKEIILEGNVGSPTQINVDSNAKVKNIEVAKNAEANVALKNSAEIKQVTVSDSATVNVIATGKDTKVENIVLSDKATGSVEVNNGATVETITTTSTGKTDIKGDGEGTVGKIEATDENTVEKNDKIETSVETITPVKTVTISGAGEVEVGKTITLTASVLPANATNKTVTWTSSDNSIATVSENGVVTGLKEGTATITAKVGSITAEKTITVKKATTSTTPTNVAVDSVTITSDITEIAKGTSVQFEASVKPTNATNKAVTWAVTATNGEDEVTEGIHIDNTGKLTVENSVPLDTVIKVVATAGGKSSVAKEMKVVETVAIKGITLDKTTVSVEKDKTVQLTATISPINATNNTVVWTTSDAEVATVSDTGLVTAVAEGTATITAKIGEISADCEVTVTEKVVTPEITIVQGTEKTIKTDETLQLTVNGAEASDITWASATPAVATVSNTGLVTGKTEGTAVITATANNGKKASITITVETIDNTEVIETSVAVGIKEDKTLMIRLHNISDITEADASEKSTSKAGTIKITERKTPANVWTFNVPEDNSAAIGFTTKYFYNTEEGILVITIPFEYFKNGSEAFNYISATPGIYDITIPEGMFSYDGKKIKFKKNPAFRVDIESTVTSEVVEDSKVQFTFKNKNEDQVLDKLILIDEKATIEIIQMGEHGVEAKYISRALKNDDIVNGVITLPFTDFTTENGTKFTPIAGTDYTIEWYIGDMGEGFRYGDITDKNPDTVHPEFHSLSIPSAKMSDDDISVASLEDLEEEQEEISPKQEEEETPATPEIPSEDLDKLEEETSDLEEELKEEASETPEKQALEAPDLEETPEEKLSEVSNSEEDLMNEE